MSISQLILSNEYNNAYDSEILKDYSEPKIYNADGDLTKRWYVYYSFRNPATGKLERQAPLYLGINRFKTLKDRKTASKNLREAVSIILKNGFNPFTSSKLDEINLSYSIKKAFEFAINFKKTTLSDNSFSDFRIRVLKFQKWIQNNGIDENLNINRVTKKVISVYLNEIANETSARNRNNTRSILSSLFNCLESNEIIKNNFVQTIPVLKSNPERNKTYSLKQEKDIFKKLEKDKILLLFIQFISFNMLRPIEVCRLKIKDLNLDEKKLFVKAKNKIDKIKIIPDILIKELPDLEGLNKDSYLFTPNEIGAHWETKETNRRDYFSKRFNEVIKKPLGLGKDYGLYSFRHTYITKLYNELLKNSTPFEAKSKLMLITGHNTMTALDKYLRDIDATLPDDYSTLIK